MSAPKITPREKEIITWLSYGKTTDDICAILACTKFTVESHKKNVMDKLGVPNATAMVASALRQGLVE